MDTYHDSKGNLREFPWIKAEELGILREHIFSVPTNRKTEDGGTVWRQFHNVPQDRAKEMFVTFEFQNGTKRYGWLTRSAATYRFTNTLFQESAFNQHIHFIEWNDRFNCVVEDGIYISQAHFWMSKEEIHNLIARMEPASEVRPH